MRACVCPSVCDGCGRGNSLKLQLLGPQRVERDERHAIVGACHCTSNGQEHKIIRRAEPKRDTIFHLRVTACRGRGSHCQDERLAWVASREQGTSCSSSFVSKVLGANYNRANNFLPVAHKFTMCTDRKQPLMGTTVPIAITGHGHSYLCNMRHPSLQHHAYLLCGSSHTLLHNNQLYF